MDKEGDDWLGKQEEREGLSEEGRGEIEGWKKKKRVSFIFN